jgi:antitoxin component of MazEF toxin-antitoxin module
MELEIQKWGNSAAIRINRALLKQINAKVGASLVAEVRNGGLFLKPAPEPQYSLDDLLVSCTKAKMRLDVEDRAWLDDAPVGKEA